VQDLTYSLDPKHVEEESKPNEPAPEPASRLSSALTATGVLLACGTVLPSSYRRSCAHALAAGAIGAAAFTALEWVDNNKKAAVAKVEEEKKELAYEAKRDDVEEIYTTARRKFKAILLLAPVAAIGSYYLIHKYVPCTVTKQYNPATDGKHSIAEILATLGGLFAGAFVGA